MQKNCLVKIPILVIFFNRPDCLKQLLAGLVNVGAKNIYFAADGPRIGSAADMEKVDACKALVESFIGGFEPTKFFNSKENVGCHTFVPKAISWFFSIEERGIILEDDCIIDEGFLRFADFALEKYRDVPEVMSISAANFQNLKVGDGDYFFSRYPYIWGWATWARAWRYYQHDANVLQQDNAANDTLNKIFKDKKQAKYWQKMLSRLAAQRINFWDAKWYFSIWMHEGLSLTPNMNLVRNIGFGVDATHTKDKRENPNMKIGFLPSSIASPSDQSPNDDADHELFMKRFSPTVAGYIRAARLKLFQFLNA